MIIYIIIFIISILATFFAERSTKQRFFFYFFSFVAILAPTLLAGFRDSGIGTDTQIYVDKIWYNIIYVNGLDEFIKIYSNDSFESVEFFYLLINWITSWFGEDLNLIYFTTNFCVLFPIYCTFVYNRKKAPMWLSMTIFLFSYYNISLNLVRQSIALAFCIYSYKYLEEKKWLKLAIWCLIIINTHNTGIFYTLFVFLNIVWYNIDNSKLKKSLLFFYSLIIPLSVLFLNYIILAAVYLGILPFRYAYYITDQNYEAIGKSMLFIAAAIFAIFSYIRLYYYRYSFLGTKTINYFCFNSFYGMILICSSFITLWASRISFYFNYPVNCLFLPKIIYSIYNKKKSFYYLITILLLSIIIIMWYWNIVLKNENETMPYKSKILGI